MKKPMIIMLICVGGLFAAIFGFHFFKGLMIKHYMATQGAPAVTVSAMKAEYSWWQPHQQFVGSLRAIKGVSVTTELAGMVQKIYFTPGASVKENDLLVQLNVDSDIALLHSLQANAELAKTVYVRDKAQYAIKAVSKATLDADAANLASQQAQVAQQIAIIAKKTIRAPFAGRLGISAVNPGQYLNAGDKVVTLQMLDPIYVDFSVPQQEVVQLHIGQPVTLTIDTYPGATFTGKITTIDPLIDTATRNVEVEATINNPESQLIPGMFASVNIPTGTAVRYLTLPQTAVSFNPYGEIIYVVEQTTDKDKKSAAILKVHQSFVTTGETRGDQIAVLQGIKAGDMVVTSGQVKLKNGSTVVINNSIVPADSPASKAIDE